MIGEQIHTCRQYLVVAHIPLAQFHKIMPAVNQTRYPPRPSSSQVLIPIQECCHTLWGRIVRSLGPLNLKPREALLPRPQKLLAAVN